MSHGGDKWNFWFFAFVVIFIAELTFMVVFSLLFPMPGIIVALLDAFLLIVIIFLIFRPQFQKEKTYQNARFAETQDTLRKSEERYRALVESTDDSIYLVNRQYCYVFMNQKHLARLGFSADKFSGRP